MGAESIAEIPKVIKETATTIKPVEANTALGKITEAPDISIGDKPLNEIQKESAMPGFDAHKMLTDMAQGKIHEGGNTSSQPLQNETQFNKNSDAFRNYYKTMRTEEEPEPLSTTKPENNPIQNTQENLPPQSKPVETTLPQGTQNSSFDAGKAFRNLTYTDKSMDISTASPKPPDATTLQPTEPYDAGKAFRKLTFPTEPTENPVPKIDTPTQSETSAPENSEINKPEEQTPEQIAKNEVTSYFSSHLKKIQEEMKKPNTSLNRDNSDMAYYEACMKQAQEGNFFESVTYPGSYEADPKNVTSESLYEHFKSLANITGSKDEEEVKKIVDIIEKSDPVKAEEAKKRMLEKTQSSDNESDKANTATKPKIDNKPEEQTPEQNIQQNQVDTNDIMRASGIGTAMEAVNTNTAEQPQTPVTESKTEQTPNEKLNKQIDTITNQIKEISPGLDLNSKEGQQLLQELKDNPQDADKISQKIEENKKNVEADKTIDDFAKNQGIDVQGLKKYITNEKFKNSIDEDIQTLTKKTEEYQSKPQNERTVQTDDENKKDSILVKLLKAIALALAAGAAGMGAAVKEIEKS